MTMFMYVFNGDAYSIEINEYIVRLIKYCSDCGVEFKKLKMISTKRNDHLLKMWSVIDDVFSVESVTQILSFARVVEIEEEIKIEFSLSIVDPLIEAKDRVKMAAHIFIDLN